MKLTKDNSNLDRNKLAAYVKTISPSAGKKLQALLDKEKEILEHGNKYGEKFTARQWDMAVDPIFTAEYERACILKLTRSEPLSVRQLANKLELPEKQVLQHITVLRKRNLIAMHEVKATAPHYLALPEAKKES